MPIIEYVPPTARFDILICAIHAGPERGTGDVARLIHAACPANTGLYVHSCGKHITSATFHEPLFDIAVRQYKTVISIHGMRSTDQIAYVGGRAKPLVRQLRQALGLSLNREPPPHLRGLQQSNVVNRGQLGAGIQVEISYPILFHTCPLRTWIADRIAATLIKC
jgi:phage replication-related protein YjqB (UPF0714/DUF867 family)